MHARVESHDDERVHVSFAPTILNKIRTQGIHCRNNMSSLITPEDAIRQTPQTTLPFSSTT